ncbi:AI-2E family transporter [Albibacterium bauzanense]|uniref:Putative PurR-regulated permease PerM n=1 Tax=Albibacterium bauzanense TaxID=653929 RepID=A0A4R1LYB1_9SPHI|nr:AI-2E family transporter [Albibacterium bauzanense]TCK83580.1 putative PurR-regulated permease PerM [Albibacterium bauzanense]
MIGKLQLSVYGLLFISLSVSILYIASAFLIPLTLAGILSMLFVRLCDKLEKYGISRALSALIAVIILLAVISTILLLLTWQLNDLTKNIEGMKQRGMSFLQSLREWINETLGISSKQQEQILKEQGNSSGETGNMLASFATSILGALVNAILIMVYIYLFLYYRSRIKRFLLKLVPLTQEAKAKKILQQATHVSQQYLSGLAVMILVLWIMYGIGFTLMGVENALFFAILCGILEIVPFIGNITGTSITVLAVIAQGGQTDQIIGVVIVYLIVQFLQTYLLEPLIVGEQVNINPLFTIMVLVGGELVWGIAGMVLAIPLLGIVKIICDNIPVLAPYGYLIGTDKKRRTNLLEKLKNSFKK